VVKPIRLFGVYERMIPDARPDARGRTEYHYILFDYLCKVQRGVVAAADDASRVRWVAQPDLDRYLLTEGTREVIEQAFRAR